MKLEYKGIIYIARNLVNLKVYIGLTIKTLLTRKGEHFRSANNKNRKEYNSQFLRAIRKYGEDNFSFEEIITIYARSSEYRQILLDLLEIYYIKKYNSRNRNCGYNTSPGGRGYGDLLYASIRHINISDRMSGSKNPFYGKTHTEENKKKMSDLAKLRITLYGHPLKGKKLSKEQIHKMSERLKGIAPKISEEAKQIAILKIIKIRSKAIDLFSLNGEFIKHWNSITLAANTLNFKRTTLNNAVRKRIKTAYGYIWKYSKE